MALFLPAYFSRDSFRWLHVSIVAVFMLLSSIPWNKCTKFISPLTHWRASVLFLVFDYFEYKDSCVGFCANFFFHFSELNAQKCNCYIVWLLHVYFFIETAKIFSIDSVAFYIPTSNIWVTQFLCFLTSISYCNYFLFMPFW